MKAPKLPRGSEKITDEALRSFLNLDTEETRQVLLEIEAPEPKVTYQKKPGRGHLHLLPKSVEREEYGAETEQKAVETTRELLDSMHIQYRFSPSARVFVAGVTPSQLQKLMVEASVRSIIPNRFVEL